LSLDFQVLYAGRSWSVILWRQSYHALLHTRQGHCITMSSCRAGALDKYDVTDSVQYVETNEPTLFSGHYLRNRSTLDIGVLGYIGIV